MMFRRIASLALVLAMLSSPLTAQSPGTRSSAAQPSVAKEETVPTALQSAAEGIVGVFDGTRSAEEVFAPDFLAAVPEARLEAINRQFVAQFGALQGVERVKQGSTGAILALRFEKAIARGPIHLDERGLVDGLLLNQFDPIDDSAQKIAADLAALPGETSIYFAPLAKGARPLLAANADAEMAIGSAFKLYVLSTLARQIEAGAHSWDEIVPLAVHSLPSGQLQAWPKGSPITLHTLATLMISNSDNTATDQLIRIVGRDAIAKELRASGHSASDKTLPLLTTLELFALKGDPALGASYVAAGEKGEAEQRRALDALAERIDGDPANITPPTFTHPTAIDNLEWFASGRDLAGILQRIAALEDPTAREIMAVAPFVAEGIRRKWKYVGYKGGSEPGVLNLTWLLQDQSGEWRILTLGWNNPDAPVDLSTLQLIGQRALSLAP